MQGIHQNHRGGIYLNSRFSKIIRLVLEVFASIATIAGTVKTFTDEGYKWAVIFWSIMALLFLAMVLISIVLWKSNKSEEEEPIHIVDLELNGSDRYIYTDYSNAVSLGGIVAINYKGKFWKDRMCLGKITDIQNEKNSKLVQVEVIYVYSKYKKDFSEAMRHKNKDIIENMIVLTSIKDQDISQIATGGQV